jgi:hypothetical protein
MESKLAVSDDRRSHAAAGRIARLLWAVVLVAAGAQAANAQALRADYQFQNTLESSVPGAPPLTNLGNNSFTADTVDGAPRAALRFARDNGVALPSATGVMSSGSYTIVVLFRFDQVSGFRRIIDFRNGASDEGAYVEDGHLKQGDRSDNIRANTYVQVVYTRDGSVASQRGYVDGRLVFRGTTPGVYDLALLGDTLRFFRDDNEFPNEASAGAVARIRVYDGALSESQVAALDRVPPPSSNPPAVKAPRRIYALVGEPATFWVFAGDPDGDAVTLSVASEPLPGATFVDEGGGRGTYTISADPSLTDTDHVVVFRADDGRGGVGTAEVPLMVGFVRGENPPRVGAAAHVVAPAPDAGRGAVDGQTEAVVEVFDPEEDLADVRVEGPPGGPEAEILPGGDAAHRVLRVRPTQTQRSQMFPMQLVATDRVGGEIRATVVVDVPPADGVEVEEFEVEWEAPPAGDAFEAPVNVFAFRAGGADQPVTGDGGGLLGYAIYASTSPGFEPSDENLVATAVATARSARVTLISPLAARTHQVWYFRVTARLPLGEGRASEEAATDVPRIPEGAVHQQGKLVIPDFGSNLAAGAHVEVRLSADQPGERFILGTNRRGTKWVVKRSAVSAPGGRRLAEVMQGQAMVYLVAVNPNGKASVPFPLVP